MTQPDMDARPTVLIVDDSPEALGFLNEVLETAGFTVLVALRGETALTLVDQVAPDVVLLDAMMPGLDGFETCRRMKKKPHLALAPVIFMTGLADTSSVIKGLQAGGVDYVTKPVVAEQLVARIKVHLANAQLTRSAQEAIDVTGRFALAVDAEARIRWSTRQAALLLHPISVLRDAILPEPLHAWLRQRIGAEIGKVGDNGGTTGLPASIAIAGGSPKRRLDVIFAGRIGSDEFLVRVKDADIGRDSRKLQARMGLTAREAEVVSWLARGKANRDIADILSLSPRTVDKHLEQIYVKLGIDNRVSAVVLAVNALELG